MLSSNPNASTLLDQAQDIDSRLAALERLVEQDPRAAVPVLLSVGERTEEPEVLLKRIGITLATLSETGIPITQFDMRDLTDTAFKAFSDWMPPKS